MHTRKWDFVTSFEIIIIIIIINNIFRGISHSLNALTILKGKVKKFRKKKRKIYNT